MLVPQDLYLGLAERSVIAGFDHGAAQDLAELDKDHPGLGDAVRAELVKAMMGFYKSRTGQKLILGKFSGMDLSNMLQKFDANPDAAITASDISSINKSAFAKIAPQLDEADKVALLGFMQLAAFRKLAGFNATLTALETQIASEPDPVLDQKIERAVQSALARFGIGEEPS